MAARRRSRIRRIKSSAPGKSFWIRPPAFSLTEAATSTGTFSDIILAPGDFEDPEMGLNDTKRGAPVVERLIVDLGFSQTVNASYFDPAGFGQVSMLVEGLVHTQSDQFASLITGSLAFDTVLENQRILGYGVMSYDGSDDVTSGRNQIAVHRTFEPKTRIKIREMAIAVSIRTNFNLGDASSLANFNYVQATMLIRVP